MSDVDFFVEDLCEKTKHKLQMREKQGMYPPRFHVFFRCSSPSAEKSLIRIEFRGAVKPLMSDIVLSPTVTSPSKYIGGTKYFL